MKNIIFVTLLILFCINSNAQPFQIKDLSASVGSWEGKLTYLDDSTGKPYTMSANIN
jgi:hypothetical protein